MYGVICRQRTENWVINIRTFIYFNFNSFTLLKFVTLSFLAVSLVKRVAKPAKLTASFSGISSVAALTSNVGNNLGLPRNFNSFEDSFLYSRSYVYY